MNAFIQKIHTEKLSPESQNGRDLSAWLNNIFLESILDNIRDRKTCGIYVATEDLGAESSIQFWRDGLNNGLSFANPREFPMTLSNSLASMIAMKLNLLGPNYTLVGLETVHGDAFIQALLDLNSKKMHECLIIKVPAFSYDSDHTTFITHLVSVSNVDDKPLALLTFSPKNDDAITLKTMDEAMSDLNKRADKDKEYFIQTDIQQDLLMKVI